MDKCAWCGEKAEQLRSIKVGMDARRMENVHVCSDECESRIKGYYEFVKKNTYLFLAGILIPIFIGIILCAFKPSLGVFIMMASIGFVVIMFPFVTPQTSKKFGFKKASLIAKIFGFLCIVFGVFALIFIR
ncbi:MAG: hypothetical protein Q8936_17370 [Bacillota bacterium]|nr:hypothetical protein [Bacillota bacterium]